jgi:small subunit ribosomal protein S20
MANTRSSKKDLRRTAKRTIRNKGTRTALKTHVKKIRTAAAAGDGEAARAALVVTSSAIDKALQRGIIHKNSAARRKSRAAKAANKISEVKTEVKVVKPRTAKKSVAKA